MNAHYIITVLTFCYESLNENVIKLWIEHQVIVIVIGIDMNLYSKILLFYVNGRGRLVQLKYYRRGIITKATGRTTLTLLKNTVRVWTSQLAFFGGE